MKEHVSHPLKEIIDRYRKNIDDLRVFLDLVGYLLFERGMNMEFEGNRDAGAKDLREMIAELESGVSNEELVARFQSASVLLTIEGFNRLLWKVSLINLISIVGFFMSDLLHFHFDQYPGALGNDFEIGLDELQSLGSISFEEAKRRRVEKKVDKYLRDGLETWIEFFRKDVGIQIKHIDDITSALVEIYQRRNLLVHNDGRVDSTYVKKVKPYLREGVARGDILELDTDYLSDAIDRFELEFILIAAEWWKKLEKNDEERPSMLKRLAELHISQQRWKVAAAFSEFMANDKGVSERSRIEGLLNYWLNIKAQGRFEEIREEVEQVDFSAKDPVYQLAKSSLLSDSTAFFLLLPDVLRSGKLTCEELNSLPIFQEMRELSEYRSVMRTLCPDQVPAVEEHKESIH